ncbi:fibronectin type III domain-containing protein [Patescibacteria group bacterium]
MGKFRLKKLLKQTLGLFIFGLGLLASVKLVGSRQEIRQSADYSPEEFSSRENDPVNLEGFITDVSVGDVSDSEATIYWQTPQSSSSTVEYGRSQNNLIRVSEAQPKAKHRLTLKKLHGKKTYFFRLRTDQGAVSSFYNFRTKGR